VADYHVGVALTESQLIASRGPSSGRGKVFAMRMAESFFRRWPLYLLPLLLFVGLGVLQAKNVDTEYRSVSTVAVSSSTFLSDLTSVRTPDVGYETPATKTARNINEQMTTAAFAKQVAAKAGLTTMLANGTITLDYVRSHVSVGASGDTLMIVRATTFDPTLSQRLAQALESSYKEYVIGVQSAESKNAAAFYTKRITDDTVAVTKATNDLKDYLGKNPLPPASEKRTELQVIELQGLQDAVAEAKTLLSEDQAQLDKTNLATSSAASDIDQRLQVLDPAELPIAPEPTRMKQIIDVAIFVLLGLIIVAVALVMSALLDRAVRSADDITEASGLEVVATIPLRRKTKGPARRRPPSALNSGAA